MLHTMHAHRVNGGYFINKIGWSDQSTTLTLPLEETIIIEQGNSLVTEELAELRTSQAANAEGS